MHREDCSSGAKWKAGDKVGHLTVGGLHELRMGAILGRAIDPDVYLQTVEALEEVLDAVKEAELTTCMTVEDAPEAIREIESERKQAAASQGKELTDLQQVYDDEQASHAEEIKEYEARYETLRAEMYVERDRLEGQIAEVTAARDDLIATVDSLSESVDALSAMVDAAKPEGLENLRNLARALNVMVRTPHIYEYLNTHDRKALLQAERALSPVKEEEDES